MPSSNKAFSLLLSSWLVVGSSTAWISTSSTPTAAIQRTTSPRSLLMPLAATAKNNEKQKEAQEMRDSIKAMKQQALERLDKLSHQMEELQEQQAALQMHQHHAETSGTFFEEPEEHEDITTPTSHLEDTITLNGGVKLHTPEQLVVMKPKQPLKTKQETPEVPASPDLLDDTWWKIGLDIRREPGTWMPAEWGASGDKLRCQLVVDFTSEPVGPTVPMDEFFHLGGGELGGGEHEQHSNPADPVKVMTIQEAWILPHGVGADQVGRTKLPVHVHGAYKVGLNQGPCGTHVLRFYVTLKEDIRPHPTSDLYLPAGRVYGTCGYFPQRTDHWHSSTAKDAVVAEYMRLIRKDQELQVEMEQETNLLSVEQIKRVKDQWAIRRELKVAAKKVQEARQKDPDRDQLRLSRSGDVGLSREGGVCCKVYKGLSMEYRILGRMEVANDEHHLHPLDLNLLDDDDEMMEEEPEADNETDFSELHP